MGNILKDGKNKLEILKQNMKKTELKEIIRKEVRKALNESDYDQAMQNLAKHINLSEPAGRNKFRAPKEQEYEVGYWEYTNYGPEGMTIEVMATSEKEAIEKAEGKTRGKRGSYKVIAIDGVKK
jgi:ATP-dependent Lon protease